LQNLETAAYQFLVEEVLQRQRTVVLIVDEAQTLSQRLLRHICKLLNWQEQGEQLLQIILVGQPVLERKLLRVPALRDRAVVEFTLTAMSLAEVQQMINQRLRQAGRRGDLFTAGATHLIAQHARGMPRRVIVLCLQSMWLAYRREQHKIRADLVQHAISHAQADVLSGMPEDAVALLAADQAAPARREPPSWMPRILQRLWVRVVS
jgi:general secretion pathway protein A